MRSNERQELGISNDSTWVYHQDEETCVGQDTLLGISDFIRDRKGLLGAGIILYPLDWVGSPSHIQELTRSYDDFRVLDSMTMPGNPTLGFHGSHILVRADVEDSVGWDAEGYAPAEDLSFEIRVRARYGSVFGVLKGFAYEKGAFSLRDQLRQRRRWVHGVMFAFTRSPELGAQRRFTLLYSLLTWFSALPSVIILVASAEFHYGPLLVYTGVFTGFVWVSMVTGYLEGFRLHAQVRRPNGLHPPVRPPRDRGGPGRCHGPVVCPGDAAVYGRLHFEGPPEHRHRVFGSPNLPRGGAIRNPGGGPRSVGRGTRPVGFRSVAGHDRRIMRLLGHPMGLAVGETRSG